MPEQARELEGNDDDTDAAHEARDDRVGHQFHILAEAHDAQQDLHDARKYDGAKNKCRVAAERRIEAGKDDDHRTGRAGNLGSGAAKQGGKEANKDGAPEAGNGAGA